MAEKVDGFDVGGVAPGGADEPAESVSTLPFGKGAESEKPAASGARPVDYPAGLPPVVVTHKDYHQLTQAQAAHAISVQIADLSRRHPAVRALVDERNALLARVSELENKSSARKNAK